MPKSAPKSKNPVGRPRKDGLPAGYYKHKKVAQAHTTALNTAASEVTGQIERRPRRRPRKHDTLLGFKWVGKASAAAPVVRPAPQTASEDSLSRSPSLLPPWNTPSKIHSDTRHKPKSGSFIDPAIDDFYDTLVSTPSDTATEFDDDTDERDGDTEDTDMEMFRLEGTERVLRRFRLDEQRKIFPLVEAEDDPPTEEELKVQAQTEEQRREASHQRQKKMCEAHDCSNPDCRLNHVRRANLDFFLQGLDQRISQLDELPSQLHELGEAVAETAAPIRDMTAVEGGAPFAYVMETEPNHESEFETLFSAIMQDRGEEPDTSA
ncbi:unnamed protein product [Alternaria alternata]